MEKNEGLVYMFFSFYKIKKALAYIRRYGFKSVYIKYQDKKISTNPQYQPWLLSQRISDSVAEEQSVKKFEMKPQISIIVPLFNTSPLFLREMIHSVRAQTYSNWELILGNASPENKEMESALQKAIGEEERIRVFKTRNSGISDNTNELIKHASGEYISLLDHDDVIERDTLYEYVNYLNVHGSKALLYCDEDKMESDSDGGIRRFYDPNFKPDFSLEMIRANNYICHFLMIRRDVLQKIGGLDSKYDGAQDYDLILRTIDYSREVGHINKVLYHWRVHNASTADNPLSKEYAYEAGLHALENHLTRNQEKSVLRHTDSPGFYEIEYGLKNEKKVLIVLEDNKDIESTLSKMSFKDLPFAEVEVVKVKRKVTAKSLNRIIFDAKAHQVIFIGYMVSGIKQRDLIQLVVNCARNGVGVVGGRIVYKKRVCSAGVTFKSGECRDLFAGYKKYLTGYMHRLDMQRNVLALRSTCFAYDISVFKKMKGLDEALDFEASHINYCLACERAGEAVVYCPDVSIEINNPLLSVSEQNVRWNEQDPYYNQNLYAVDLEY
ncbi:glycosyltransferase involved in cell wall biosynthesis [Lachnospiraceae bacterium PFB1-21]